jgi:hypothetical protein
MQKGTTNMNNNDTKVYDNIETLPLYNWDKYLSTKDTNWFRNDFDGRQSKHDPFLKEEESILEEYFTAINDRSFTIKMQKWAKINSLVTKYSVVNHILDRFLVGFSNEQMQTRHDFVEQLRKHGFKILEINTELGDLKEVERIRQEVQGIKTKIKLLESELKEDGNKESTTLQRQLQIATLGLGYSYRLNPKEISVAEWIEICKMLEEKNK